MQAAGPEILQKELSAANAGVTDPHRCEQHAGTHGRGVFCTEPVRHDL
jgi:hypothetical protein